MPFCNRTKIAEAYAREDGIEYRYILEEERLFGVKTYSVSVYMIFCGKESFCRIESIAADKARLILFFNKISRCLASPANLAYAAEDEGLIWQSTSSYKKEGLSNFAFETP